MLAGTELRKQRRLSEVLTDSINVLFAHWRPLAIISVPVVVANIAFSLVILAITQDVTDADEITTEEALELLLLLGASLLVAVPIIFVLQQLVTGGTVEYLDESDKGNPLQPAEALDRAQDQLGALIGAALRAYAIIILLSVTIIGIPWAIARGIRWAFLAQVIMVEGLRGSAVLERSAALVQGRWWNTFGRLIVVGLVVQIPVGFLQSALTEAFPGILGTILVGATGFIYVPFGIIGLSLMFFDLRARKEEEDVPRTPQEPVT